MMAWQPLTRSPRRPRIACEGCATTAPNEDRALRGWTVSAGIPPRYRCPACSEALR